MALGTVINDLQTPSPEQTIPQPICYSPTRTHISILHICLFSLVPGYNQANYPPKTPVKPNARIHTLYMEGADPSTANSPPSFRCPRHLHTGCEICVEARSPVRVVTRPGRSSSASNQPSDRNLGPAPTWMGTAAGMSADGGGITGWQDGSGIGSGLSRSAATGSVLRRKLDETPGGRPGGGNTKLSMLISRFLRLSALAASELGREAREEAGFESPQSPPKERDSSAYGGKMYGELSPLPGPASTSTMRAIQEAQNRLYGLALRPTRQWYMLLAGLLTRAALEGYLTGEWKGAHAVECLLTVGLGIIEGREVDGVDKDYEEYEPDELPTLSDAARMLFPSLRPGAPLRKGDAEAEYEMEMDERLRRFYDIPLSTPDLSTHMEDLAWQYPAEPVERAAVRFCEAIAKWRGKPELETYKKKPGMSLDMFVQQPSATPSALPPRLRGAKKPDINLYFKEPFAGAGAWKRSREPEEAGGWKRSREPEEAGASKRVRV
ncbi:hypothetical protein BDZ89DRAFT_1173889 [Hymenopellis radicata]|nr:hypothetical protein BDZ89DRAFT_1173889 [Hymenopellis radicata]